MIEEEKHTTKTWYEDYIKLFPKETQKETCRIVCKEVCKKILEECHKKWEKIQLEVTSVYNDKDLMPHDIKNIIKELGVDL